MIDIKILPILNKNFKIVRLVNFRDTKNILPINAIIMAGGEGRGLRQLTLKMPKPLLKGSIRGCY